MCLLIKRPVLFNGCTPEVFCKMVLKDAVSRCTVGDKEIFIVGTAHVSQASVDDVRETIKEVDPDCICVELCKPRYEAMVEKTRWKKMDIFQIVKDGKAVFLLGQLLMSSYYKRIAEKLGVEPGAEMKAAIEMSEGKELVLADRKIEVTLKRVWRHLGLFEKFKIFSQMMASIVSTDEVTEEMIEELKAGEELDGIMDSFAKAFPQVKERLIDERDLYLAEKIRSCPGKRVVAAVGAGHVPGILRAIEEPRDLKPLEEIPPVGTFGKVAKWILPLAILALLILGISRGGSQQAIDSALVWIIAHGVLSGTGALIALGHPLTILASAVASPITSLNPMIAAGWVAGLVQAWVKKPTVEDFENLPDAVSTVSGFWMNPVSRVLLVVVLANLGSGLGTLVAGLWMAAKVV